MRISGVFDSMLFFFFALQAQAQAKQFGTITSALSYHRLGLSIIAQHGKYVPKWEKENSILFQNTGIRLVGELNVSPSYIQPGFRFIVQPIAIVKIQGYGFGHSYFGNFQTIVGYDSLDFNYGNNSVIAEYVENTQRQYSGFGTHVGGNIVLQAKIQDFVVLSSTDVSHWNIRRPSGEDGNGFFEREKEIMLQLEGDQILENNSLVLYQIDQKEDQFIRVGSFTTFRKAIISEDVLLRTGILFSMQKNLHISHILICQGYLQDRSYTDLWPSYIAYALKYSY